MNMNAHLWTGAGIVIEIIGLVTTGIGLRADWNSSSHERGFPSTMWRWLRRKPESIAVTGTATLTGRMHGSAYGFAPIPASLPIEEQLEQIKETLQRIGSDAAAAHTRAEIAEWKALDAVAAVRREAQELVTGLRAEADERVVQHVPVASVGLTLALAGVALQGIGSLL